MLRKLVECIGATALLALALIGGLAWADRAMGAPADSPSLPSPYMLDASTLAYVDCLHGAGTAVYLGEGRYITAAHVIHGDQGCAIGGKPVTIEHINVVTDWALIRSDARLPYHVTISCARLVEGQMYLSSGYAEANPWPVTTRLIAQDYREDRESFLRGNIVNGMSGGPVSDLDGVVHGINDTRSGNGVPESGVVELADTVLCAKPAH